MATQGAKRGRPKPAGSGRKRGTPNRSSLKAREVLENVNKRLKTKWDPLEFHIMVAMGREGEPSTMERLSAADKVLRRLYPELKSLEVQGNQAAPIPVVVTEAISKL